MIKEDLELKTPELKLKNDVDWKVIEELGFEKEFDTKTGKLSRYNLTVYNYEKRYDWNWHREHELIFISIDVTDRNINMRIVDEFKTAHILQFLNSFTPYIEIVNPSGKKYYTVK